MPVPCGAIPLMSSFGEISVWLSISITGACFRMTLVEVLESTFGHDGAFVSALNRSRSSEADVLLSLPAVVKLHNVMENPGPFSDVSNVSENILVGRIFQLFSEMNETGSPGDRGYEHT